MPSESLQVAALIACAVHALRSPLKPDDFTVDEPENDGVVLEPTGTRETFDRLTFPTGPNNQFQH